MRSLGITPRMSVKPKMVHSWRSLCDRDQDPWFPGLGSTTNRRNHQALLFHISRRISESSHTVPLNCLTITGILRIDTYFLCPITILHQIRQARSSPMSLQTEQHSRIRSSDTSSRGGVRRWKESRHATWIPCSRVTLPGRYTSPAQEYDG